MSDQLADAIANTDQELMAYALDGEPEEQANYRHSEPGDRSLEDMSGWDSAPLPIEEIAAASTDSTVDRPLQLARDEEFEAEVGVRDQEIARLQGRLREMEALSDPGYVARQHAAREEALDRVMMNPQATLAEMNSLRAQVAQSNMAALGSNLAATHREHGASFEKAYRALTSLDPTSPVDRATVQAVLAQPDPGQAVLDWHARGGRSNGTAEGRTPPPFMRGVRSGGGRAPMSNRGPEAMEEIPGNMGSDHDIFDSVWR